MLVVEVVEEVELAVVIQVAVVDEVQTQGLIPLVYVLKTAHPRKIHNPLISQVVYCPRISPRHIQWTWIAQVPLQTVPHQLQ